MRILQLCNKPPLPAVDGGCLAMHSVTEGLLDAGMHVRVLAIETQKHPFLREQVSAEYLKATQFEAIFVDTELKWQDATAHLFRGESYNISRFYSEHFAKRLVEILSEENFDVIHLESLYMISYLPLLRKNSRAKIVLRAHNTEHQLWKRRATVENNPLKKLYLQKLTRQLEKAETSALHLVDAIVPITQEDAEVFRDMTDEPLKIHVLPYAMRLPQMSTQRAADPLSVFHIGAMDWAPNTTGVRWFLDHCWAEIVAAAPGASLHLAGKNLAKDDPQYAGKNAVVHGEVKNAHAFMNEYAVMAVPLVSGGGMRVKLVEAMALGKPIVTTTVGAEGTGLVHEQHALIADTPSGFSQSVIRLLNDPAFACQLGLNAHQLAGSEFELSSAAKKLVAFYRSLLV